MKMSLYQLYLLKEKMEQENLSNEEGYLKLCEKISQREQMIEDGKETTSNKKVIKKTNRIIKKINDFKWY